MSSLVRWLGARHAPWIVIAIGIALALPAITADFAADDHLHRVIARDDPGIAGLTSRPLDLFVFASGDPAANLQLRDAGLFPWWTDPSLKLSFMRPLSSATHALDHSLWPDSAPLQLAHNLLWHALALVVVWLAFRRFIAARWIAVLALALFAFDDARGPVVGWIANRNALVALCLAVPVLLAHDRWRRDGWTPGRFLAPALLCAALCAGESAVAILAYLVAHVLWLDRGSWRDRVLALVPYLLVVACWRVIYVKLGYGVVGSGIYLDPGADPIGFLQEATVRLPFLLLSQLAAPWSDISSFYAVFGVLAIMLAIALVVLVAIGWAFARLVRRDATARFFATGMLLAAVPVASTFPADRLLTFTSLGAMGLVAQFLAAAVNRRELLGDTRPRRFGAGAVAIVLLVVHLVLAPPALVIRARSMVAVGRVLDRADASIPSDGTVIIAGTPSDALAAFIPYMRRSRHQDAPAHLYSLAPLTTAVTIERVDDRTLRVAPDGGFFLYDTDQMTRSPRSRPFRVGERVELSGLSVEVESVTADRRPRTVIARFARPLDDASLTWLTWEGGAYVPYRPPAIGARHTLPAVDILELLLSE